MTRETEEETIKRRSENAEAAVGLLFDAYEWLWIIVGVVVGFVLLTIWLLG